MKRDLLEYINAELPKCTRVNSEDEDSLIGLPFPYTVPSTSGTFQEMYYWDTYFTNHGLILRGNIRQAKNNVENMFFLVERFGFMPNGNRTHFLYNSQPPFLSLMVRDIYEAEGDKEWLERAIRVLEIEYDFWQTKRNTPTGLNRYDGNVDMEGISDKYADYLVERLGFCPQEERETLMRGMYASGESGWDLNPRMSYQTFQYNAVDLNSLLFALEDNLSFFCSEIGEQEKSAEWNRAAQQRAQLCRKFLLNKETNLYYDYNFEKDELGEIFSVASLFPLFVGMANDEEARAAEKALERLETDYGVLSCERNDIKGQYQWDYPNGWAPLQYVTVMALERYGYHEHAKDIAKKFVSVLEKCYEKTGHLWEKYNVLDGTINASNEYTMPTMMGWTFGVYMTFLNLLQ